MNKKLKSILFFSTLFFIFSCSPKNSKSDSISLIGTLEEVVKMIRDYEGDVKDFQLALNENLVADSFSMAIITDAMIKKRWTFNGSKEVNRGKIYFYKKM